MRKLFKERKLFKGGNYMRKYGIQSMKKHWVNLNCQNSEPTKRTVNISATVKIAKT